jgi:ABC-type transport system substrate-binding protein
MRFLCAILIALSLAACGPTGPDGPVEVAIIGESDSLADEGLRLSPAAQHLRAATTEGLVALNASGQVIPALAERWIVTDDGQSYIFRLRNSDWTDGTPITADDVRQSLLRVLRQLRGTSLGLDLTKIDEIRAMTGRVIEIRLTGPMPDFLQLLAQPELGLANDGVGAGPMAIDGEIEDGLAKLIILPPEQRGLPMREDWDPEAHRLLLRALPAGEAVDAFSSGDVDLVLNGQLASLPLADTGPLTRGTVRLDAALGVFGFVARNNNGVLSTPELREAIAMAIDRTNLMQPFNIGGWRASTWIVPLELSGDEGPAAERWAALTIAERRAIASRRIAAWEGAQSEEAVVRISLPAGPGSDMLFAQLTRDLAQVGISARRVDEGQPSDLEFFDRLARYYAPRWYLNQFNCRLELGLCSEVADDLVEQSIMETDAAAKARLLQAANRELARENIFIPLGAPVRWSLVRGNITGFAENAWGMHPLFQLADPTI